MAFQSLGILVDPSFSTKKTRRDAEISSQAERSSPGLRCNKRPAAAGICLRVLKTYSLESNG